MNKCLRRPADPRATLAALKPFVIVNAACPACDGDLWYYPVENHVVCLTCPTGPTLGAALPTRFKRVA